MDKQSKGPIDKQKNTEIKDKQNENPNLLWISIIYYQYQSFWNMSSISFYSGKHFFIGDWKYQQFITVKEQNNTFEVELIQFPFFWNLEVIQIRIKKVTTI